MIISVVINTCKAGEWWPQGHLGHWGFFGGCFIPDFSFRKRENCHKLFSEKVLWGDFFEI